MNLPGVKVTAWIDKHEPSGVFRIRLVLPGSIELGSNEVYSNIEAAKDALAEIAKYLKADMHYAN